MRYIGHRFKGLKNEVLYPPNAMPEAMHAVDDILEKSTDFLHSYAPFVVPIMPGYQDRANRWNEFLADGGTLPKLLETLEACKKRRGFHSPYLVTECMSIGDLAMYSHFWKLMVNPEAE